MVISNDEKVLIGSFPFHGDMSFEIGSGMFVGLCGGAALYLKVDVACCIGRLRPRTKVLA